MFVNACQLTHLGLSTLSGSYTRSIPTQTRDFKKTSRAGFTQLCTQPRDGVRVLHRPKPAGIPANPSPASVDVSRTQGSAGENEVNDVDQ